MRLLLEFQNFIYLFFFFVESKQKKTTFLCTLNRLKRRQYIGKQKRQHFYTLKNV